MIIMLIASQLLKVWSLFFHIIYYLLRKCGNFHKLTSQILESVIGVLEVRLCLLRWHNVLVWVVFSGWYILANILYCSFISLSLCLPVSRSIDREYLLGFPKPSISYLGVWYCVEGWCRPWIRDWGWSCPVTWWLRGQWGLTRTGWRRGIGWLCSFSSWRGKWYKWRCWCISNSIYQVFTVFFVNS